jgi:hypothetical protein
MALLKSVNTAFGIDATYWNIASMVENYKSKANSIILHGYLDQDARTNNMQPIITKSLLLTDDEYIKDATREAVYLTLKAKDFANSKDC